MKEYLDSRIKGKRVLILGIGAEGKSTYRLFRKLYPEQIFTLADRREDPANDIALKHSSTKFRVGSAYLDDLDSFDLIIKSPGISLKQLPPGLQPEKLTSQTELFLDSYRKQTIGITGTKGKSTTASLTHHLLTAAGKDALLIGNIGVPPFDVQDRIKDNTLIVFELSSHQLEGLKVSPHIAVLLNIYQEHLDHYADYRAYQLAKYNITCWQETGDYFICHYNDSQIQALINETPPASLILPFALDSVSDVSTYISEGQIFSRASGFDEKVCDLKGLKFLAGNHNLLNLLAALSACQAAGIKSSNYCHSLESFKGLEHRMEFVGEFGGIKYYNDSIATIPEAVIYALETIKDVDTLMLGGFDRGVDYQHLITYLAHATLTNIYFTGNAGKRMMLEIEAALPGKHKTKWFDDFDQMVTEAIQSTGKGRSCLLSPAAASYDKFMNFEHRGNRFREIIRSHFAGLR